MKIVSLHIYHFGALQDCKLTLERSGFQLLFGENEAGKTTLMDFIRCMFFGFPVKNQAQRRYEPKNGNRMGGKITVEHPQLGVWSIERVASSKVAGDVTIFNDMGQQKEESFLIQLLDRMDQSLFTGAYCFGLDGLQKLDKLTSEELGNFLLSTAISGDRDLLEIEQSLERKQSNLFKKAGRKPVINEKLEQLKTADGLLLQQREKNENYLQLKKKKENLEEQIKETKHELEYIQKDLRSLKRLFELKPVLEKYKQLQIELNSYDPSQMNYPENGIQRYEQWQKEVSLLEGEMQYIDDRLEKLANDHQLAETDENLLIHEKEIKQLFNKLPHYELLVSQIEERNREAFSLKKAEEDMFEAMGETWTRSELASLSLSLSSLQGHEELLKQSVYLQEKKRRLENELEDSRVKLERLEKEEAEQKAILLPEEEYTKYEKIKQQKTVFPLYAMVLPVISAVVLIWSGWSSDGTAVMIAGILLLLVAGVMTFSNLRKTEKTSHELPHHTDQRLLEDEVNRKQWVQLTAALSHENKVYLQVAKQLDYLELEEAKVVERAEQWAEQNKYSGELEKLFVSGYVQSLFKVKQLQKEHDAIIEKIEEWKTDQWQFEKAVGQFGSNVEMDLSHTVSDLITEIHTMLEKQLRNRSEREHLNKSSNEILERKEALSKQSVYLKKQITELWDGAGVRSEDDYYQQGRRVSAFHKLVEERETLHTQLLSLGFSSLEIEKLVEKVTEKYDETVQHYNDLEEKEEERQADYTRATEDKANHEWELKKLLEDGTYSEHLHRYELLKQEWNKLVKKWASLRLAQHALQSVKEDYQKTKLPAVLETSSAYFSKITEGEYKAILFTEANEIMVLKADGTRYYPYELSRGTAEQVYLSIRLAVASNGGPADFPIFMDDIAVNFDEKRTKRTLALIQEAAQDRQVLYFTCHSHLASIVPTAPLVHWPSQTVLTEK